MRRKPLGSSFNLTQNEGLLNYSLEHTKKLLTEGEKQICAAVQQKPLVNLFPSCIVVTNKRVIKYEPRLLKATFTDFLWKELKEVHLSDRLFGSELEFDFNGGHIVAKYLPKDQAKRVYSIAQEREEEWVEKRRLREIEEERAKSGASQIIVDKNDEQEDVKATSIKSKLLELNDLLNEGLITQDEYQIKKNIILKDF